MSVSPVDEVSAKGVGDTGAGEAEFMGEVADVVSAFFTEEIEPAVVLGIEAVFEIAVCVVRVKIVARDRVRIHDETLANFAANQVAVFLD